MLKKNEAHDDDDDDGGGGGDDDCDDDDDDDDDDAIYVKQTCWSLYFFHKIIKWRTSRTWKTAKKKFFRIQFIFKMKIFKSVRIISQIFGISFFLYFSKWNSSKNIFQTFASLLAIKSQK